MNIINFIRLLLKHKVLLIVLPILTSFITLFLTKNLPLKYSSHSIIYTGIGSDSSIELEKSFNLFKTNIAFDNLINIIKSRKTQEEVALRLLSENIVDTELKTKTKLEDVEEEISKVIPYNFLEAMKLRIKDGRKLQTHIDTLKNKIYSELKGIQSKDEINFINKLLSSDSKFYSIKAISKIRAYRINSSDLVKINYESSHPYICQKTLDILFILCEKKYKVIKESNSNDIVKYFNDQLKRSKEKLKSIEQELLKFNIQNNIINYYEQSKAVAIMKEDMTLDFFDKKGELRGATAKVTQLESKLKTVDLIKKKRKDIEKMKSTVVDLKIKLSFQEGIKDKPGVDNLKKVLKEKKSVLSESIVELFRLENTIEGVPIKKVLDKWLNQSMELENKKAKYDIVGARNIDYDKKFKKYAPAGANLKRIDREFNIAEQEYLEILHGLNLAKLKLQDSKIGSKLKVVAPPFYPIKAMPSSRKLLVVGAFIFGIIIVIGSILLIEFFDNTLKNIQTTLKVVKLPFIGILPKVFITHGKVDIKPVYKRLFELIFREINQNIRVSKKPKTKIISIISTRKHEGKTIVSGNLARQLKKEQKSVVVFNYRKNYLQFKYKKKYILNKVFGYSDPRSDYNNPILANPSTYLENNEYLTYESKEDGFEVDKYKEFIDKTIKKSAPEYVIIEHPNLINFNYSIDLLSSSDLIILVCRSNRVWGNADENAISSLKNDEKNKFSFLINGSELNEVEYLLGEIKKNQSLFRKRIKNLFRLQFNSSNKI